MVKEYRDDFLGEKAFEKLNKDIDANPGVGFEIVGYTQTAFVNGMHIPLTAILVKWNNFFKESEWDKRHLEVSRKKVYYDSIDFLYEEGIGQRPVPFNIVKGGSRCITNLSDHPWNPRSGRSSVIG